MQLGHNLTELLVFATSPVDTLQDLKVDAVELLIVLESDFVHRIDDRLIVNQLVDVVQAVG